SKGMRYGTTEQRPQGDARAARAAHAGECGTDARLRDHGAYPGRVAGHAAHRGGLAVPGAAPHGAGRLAALVVGHDGEEPRGALLRDHAEGAAAAGGGAGELVAPERGREPRAAVRV